MDLKIIHTIKNFAEINAAIEEFPASRILLWSWHVYDVSKRIFALTEGHRADVSASNSIAIVPTGEKKNEVYPPYAVSRSAQPNTTTITDKGRMVDE